MAFELAEGALDDHRSFRRPRRGCLRRPLRRPRVWSAHLWAVHLYVIRVDPPHLRLGWFRILGRVCIIGRWYALAPASSQGKQQRRTKHHHAGGHDDCDDCTHRQCRRRQRHRRRRLRRVDELHHGRGGYGEARWQKRRGTGGAAQNRREDRLDRLSSRERSGGDAQRQAYGARCDCETNGRGWHVGRRREGFYDRGAHQVRVVAHVARSHQCHLDDVGRRGRLRRGRGRRRRGRRRWRWW